jgi:glycosyltransferase involved in cell wall biosynthesis
MACGLACVVTPLALQGFEVTAGKQLLVGENEDELCDAIATILADESVAQELGTAARDYVRVHHSWSAVARSYEGIYGDVLRGS